MADLTMRDAAKVERDRLIQFSQYGSALRLRFYDREGALLREVRTYWNRYRKTTRENAVYYSFKIADFKREFASDLEAVGDGGQLGVFLKAAVPPVAPAVVETPPVEPRYRVSRVDGWEEGESRIWTVTADSIAATRAGNFRSP